MCFLQRSMGIKSVFPNLAEPTDLTENYFWPSTWQQYIQVYKLQIRTVNKPFFNFTWVNKRDISNFVVKIELII